MAHTAIAYAKQLGRKRAMMVTSSIGPGATNMVTAAALAHVNRLPVLLVPGDVFASRGPDPVLQQPEDFTDGTVSANDCFRPVSRYFDRIARPEQLLTALPRAMRVLTDPADCGPVTLAFCQDTQAEAYDYPEAFFETNIWHQRRPEPDSGELARALEALRAAARPVIIAGGGVHYSDATDDLRAFAEAHQIPITETQAGKSALPWDHPLNFGPQDFTTGSWSIFGDTKILALNVQPYDGIKRRAQPLVADAKAGLAALSNALGAQAKTPPKAALKEAWFKAADAVTNPPEPDAGNTLPTDMQVIGAVQRAAGPDTVVMCAAGTMPGELHKLWKAGRPMSYHMEYQDGRACARRDLHDRRWVLYDGKLRAGHGGDDGSQDHAGDHG